MLRTVFILGLVCLAHPHAWCSGSSSVPKEVFSPKLKPFELSQVRLLDGQCREAQELTRRYRLYLDPDRLLNAFRTNAKLAAPGKPLGGWESPTGIGGG